MFCGEGAGFILAEKAVFFNHLDFYWPFFYTINGSLVGEERRRGLSRKEGREEEMKNKEEEAQPLLSNLWRFFRRKTRKILIPKGLFVCLSCNQIFEGKELKQYIIEGGGRTEWRCPKFFCRGQVRPATKKRD